MKKPQYLKDKDVFKICPVESESRYPQSKYLVLSLEWFNSTKWFKSI